MSDVVPPRAGGRFCRSALCRAWLFGGVSNRHCENYCRLGGIPPALTHHEGNG